MKNFKPIDLVLRCYAKQTSNNKWYGICLDFNLASEATSLDELKKTMEDMIIGYVETVMDTKDYESIPRLLQRKAPFIDWLQYYFFKSSSFIRQFPNNIIFNKFLPVQFVPSNS